MDPAKTTNSIATLDSTATSGATTTAAASKSSKYVRDFELLFVPIRTEQLRDKARNGNLRYCQFRSLCWRYFLHCLPQQYDQWLASCERSRSRYEQVKQKHYDSLRELISAQGDDNDQKQSSSQSPPSPINGGHDQHEQQVSGISSKFKQELEDEQQYIKAANSCDYRNLLRTIERDVVRTFPDMEFFRQTEMQGILERVLFNFANENSHISYKQGMHELLATLLYVLHTDSQNCLINHQGGYANEIIATLLNIKYLEHDTYQLFSALMKSIDTWYQNDEILTTTPESSARFNGQRVSSSASTSSLSSSSSSRQQVSSVLGIKLKTISENIVRNFDLELFNHLEALQIAPQIYGIRWMRLLFGREFEFLDLLVVWDAIICDQVSMSLTDYIFASMLITIREELVNGDYTDCLNNLMRHQFKDVQHVIKLALHLRNPKLHPCPKEQHKPGIRKNFSQNRHHHDQHNGNSRVRSTPDQSSLTSRLSQQYISVKQQLQQANSRYEQWSSSSGSSHIRGLVQQKLHQQLQPPKSRQQQHQQQQQYRQQGQMLTNEKPLKEYEMREMQSTSSTSNPTNTTTGNSFQSNRSPLDNIYRNSSRSNFANMSTESYEDLHSIVDYCWRLLSEQIDSLQRCLPKEKSLHSEDEIFVALAQLKKVRDVLKGSLRLEDELEPSHSESKAQEKK